MSFDSDRLYRLLPAAYRPGDANAAGGPPASDSDASLRSLIEIIADQVAVLEEELEQLYDNQFVETAAPWVLPYIGDLLGIHGLDFAGGREGFAPRAEVANTIAYRRRKGTAAMLEQLARDIMQRPAAAVEFWSRLVCTQHVNHMRLTNCAWAGLRDALSLEFIGTPFEKAVRTVEVRRIEPGLGRWNIPNVGLFVWRLQDFSRTRSPLVPATEISDNRHYRLHPLGFDMALCAVPDTETDIEHLAGEEDVPVLLTRRLFSGIPVPPMTDGTPLTNQVFPDERWYGSERKSVCLWRLDTVSGKCEGIAADKVIVCDLHDVLDDDGNIVRWGHDTVALPGGADWAAGRYLLDPLRGRVVAPPAESGGAQAPLAATFATLFPAAIGGGEYSRSVTSDAQTVPLTIAGPNPPDNAISAAVVSQTGGVLSGDVVIEIADSGIYTESFSGLSGAAERLTLQARGGCAPVVSLSGSWSVEETDALTLDGLLITGGDITIQEPVKNVSMRHCTLTPQAVRGGHVGLRAEPLVIKVTAAGAVVDIENCIIGPLHVAAGTSVRMRNCVIDAGSAAAWAICSSQTPVGIPAGSWQIENCTVIGNVAVHDLELASNTIFHGESILVQRRQEGCVRFCRLPDVAAVPRRHKCVPSNEGCGCAASPEPQFISTCYGDASYCQLSRSCPDAILYGADDECEMGVYHDSLERRRERYLRGRLNEYLRFGLEAGVFYEHETPKVRG